MQLRFECDNRWDDFEGESATARRCPQCDHMVHNLSAMTRDEARDLIRDAESRLCVTYARRGGQVLFAEDIEKLESQRAGVRQLVRAAAVVAPLLIAGCLDNPEPKAQPAEIDVQVRFGEGAAAVQTPSPTDVNPEYQRYLRDKQRREAVERAERERSIVDKMGDELDRMMDKLFGEEERKFDQGTVVAGAMVEF